MNKKPRKGVSPGPSSLPPNPLILELNAVLFLNRMKAKYKKSLSLATIPSQEWKALHRQGYDAVWFMGLWKRSPEAKSLALSYPDLKKAFDRILPGWKENDVTGSPYAIHDYTLEPRLGKSGELAKLKKALNQAGLKLIVDFVPNHLALDHPLTRSRPQMFIQGTEEDGKKHPDRFYEAGKGIWLAHGRDPYFPPWSDTVQVNYFSSELRQWAKNTLLEIAHVADGVRCDMAMLGLHQVFRDLWQHFIKKEAVPEEEYWSDVIRTVRSRHPDFTFIAEVYWDLEGRLQQLGFDYTYDKRFYDYLLRLSPSAIASYLWGDLTYQNRTLRFLENHDERRAVEAFGKEKSKAAAVALISVPGAKMIFEGQAEGKCLHVPVQLGGEAGEKGSGEISRFYKQLLKAANHPVFHEGQWTLLLASEAWKKNHMYRNILCWAWSWRTDARVIVINYSDQKAEARIHFPHHFIFENSLHFKDLLGGETYKRDREEVRSRGLYVELGPWAFHWLSFPIQALTRMAAFRGP